MTDEQLQGDGWTPSTGLADDFDGVITDSYFTRDSKFPPEAAILKLVVMADDQEIGEQTILLSCGNGYDILDNGARIVHESQVKTGKNRAFNNNSNAWAFIQSAAKSGAAKTMQERGTMWDAGVWTGLKFHFKREQYKPFNSDEPKNRMVVTSFLGVGGESKGATQQRTEAAPQESNGVAPLLRAKLVKTAQEAKDHDDFMDKAFAIEGVAGNQAAEALVMSTGKGSIWASRESGE